MPADGYRARDVCGRVKGLVFPSFLLVFEVAILVVFGLLVEYDEPAKALPGQANSSATQQLALNADVGSLESSNVVQASYPFFQDIHFMVFVGFGFLVTLVRRYGYSGVGYNLLLGAFCIQWATVVMGLFSFIQQAQDGAESYKIVVSLKSMVQYDFSTVAVLVTFGAVLGKTTPLQLIIMALLEVIFYSANQTLNSHILEAADVGRSLLIHTFGAYFGLSVSLILYKKRAFEEDKTSSTYRSDLFAMLGTLFLWIFWPSFNGALASGNAQYRAVINTYYAMTGSVLASFVFSAFLSKEHKFNMIHIQHATLAGGVGIGAVADMIIQPWGALFIGACSGAIAVIGYRAITPLLRKYLYLQDSCGVHNFHGLPGVLSGIASIVAAAVADTHLVSYENSLYVVFPARAPSSSSELTTEQQLLGIGPGQGRSSGTQALFQLALLANTLITAIIGGVITGVVVLLFGYLLESVPVGHFFDDFPYWKVPDDVDKKASLPETNPAIDISDGFPMKEYVLENKRRDSSEDESDDDESEPQGDDDKSLKVVNVEVQVL